VTIDGVWIGDRFNPRLLTTFNYSAIHADFHSLKISAADAKSFQSAAVSTSRSLVTASNSGNFSTAPTKSSLHIFPYN
jgi:hypothetical protein